MAGLSDQWLIKKTVINKNQVFFLAESFVRPESHAQI